MGPVQHNPARLRAKSQLDSINVLAQVHALYSFKICFEARYEAVCCHYPSGYSIPFVWLAVIPRLGRLFLLGRAWSGLPSYLLHLLMERDRKMRGAASTGAYNRPQTWSPLWTLSRFCKTFVLWVTKAAKHRLERLYLANVIKLLQPLNLC